LRKKGSKVPKKSKPKAAAPESAPKINPLTKQPYDKKSGMGFVEGGNVNIDNIIVKKPRKPAPKKKAVKAKSKPKLTLGEKLRLQKLNK
jgi:hypothetical protein